MLTPTVRYRLPKSLTKWSAAFLGLCLAGCQPEPGIFEVASSSMAPALLGPTRQAVCPHCRSVFPVAAETYHPEFPTRCNVCGGSCRVSSELSPGTRVRLHSLSANQTLQRFELVAFDDPASGDTHVKRIWGLPGEGVAMRDGDVYIRSIAAHSPSLLQKSLQQLRQLCVPVSRFPADQISHWYLSTRAASPSQYDPWGKLVARAEHWRRVEDFTGEPRSGIPLVLVAGQTLQWRYQRPARVHIDAVHIDTGHIETGHTAAEHAHAVPPSQWLTPSPVIDDYEVNQGVSCQLHPVDDYLLSLQLQSPLVGELRLWWQHATGILPLVFHEPHTSLTTSEFPDTLSPHRFPARRRILVAWCDQRLLVETDLQTVELDTCEVDRGGEQAAIQSNPAGAEPYMDTHTQLQIQATRELRLSQIVVARDLYFEDWEATAEATDGYFVMGDNLPVSIDSRSGLGRITPEQVVGRVQKP